MAMKSARAIPPTLKMRQRNNAEEKFLCKRLVEIESDYRVQNRKLITEIAELNNRLNEFERDGGDHCLEYFNKNDHEKPKPSLVISQSALKLAQSRQDEGQGSNIKLAEKSLTGFHFETTNGLRFTEHRDRHGVPGNAPLQASVPPNECVYGSGIRNIRCEHFPCTVPRSYNSIGYQIITRPYPPRQQGLTPTLSSDDTVNSTDQKNNSRVVVITEESTSVSPKSRERGNKHGKASIREKVHALKNVLDERKRKLAETKPKAWETNYGDTVPLRQIMNPLRPAPTDGEPI